MFNLNEGLLHYVYPTAEYVLNYPPLVLIPAILGICLISYLLGSINSAMIISRMLYGEDVRTRGSGNAGMTNMLRNYGKGAAGLTLLFDLLKTVISIFIAGTVFGFQYVGGVSISDFCYVAGIFAMLGHIFPVYYNFRGGKGVLVASTMALMLSPIVFAILFLLFVAIVYLSRYVSLGSVTVGVLYPVVLSGYFSFTFNGTPMPAFTALSSIVLAIIIVWCHRKNLKRISERTENKISFGKKSGT